MVKKIFAACLAGGVFALAPAQSGPGIYIPGHSIKDQGISLRTWGSGTVAETDETAYEGTTSIRIYSRNYFQGGIIQFAKPVDLTKPFEDVDNLLELTFRLADSAMTIPAAGGAPKPGAQGQEPKPPASKGGRMGRGAGGGVVLAAPTPGAATIFFYAPATQGGIRRGGGGGGGEARGGGGGSGGGQAAQREGAKIALSPVETLRIIVTTTDNLRSEFYIPIASSFAIDRGWRNIAFPLTAISGFGRTNKIVKEIAVSADGQATLFIGGMRIVNDTTPITGDVNVSELNVGLGEKVLLQARGFAGSTLLDYDWDFDASDGLQVDATGPSVTRVFNRAGTYKITVTFRDKYGHKKSAVKTITAVVNP